MKHPSKEIRQKIAEKQAVVSFTGQKLAWLKYPASVKLDQLTANTILLENKNNNHYNVVLSLKPL